MEIYLIVVNIIGFIIMWIDKYKAKHRKWRIPESMLMFFALIGGSVGVYLGMYVIKHKTKKVKFYLGVPVILIIQIIVITMLR